MPVKKMNLEQMREFLKRYNIPDRSKLNSKTKARFLFTTVEKLVKTGIIKPYQESGKRYREPVTAKMRIDLEKKDKSLVMGKLFREYMSFDKKKRSIIDKVMTGENWTKDYYGRTILFHLTKLYHYQLPSGNVESAYKQVEQEIRRNDHSMSSVDVYTIKYLENSILENGLMETRPLSLAVSRLYNWSFGINGGNHRLQAIRNLIYQKQITKRTKIPCLVFVEINNFHSYTGKEYYVYGRKQ